MAEQIPFGKFFKNRKALIVSPAGHLRVTIRGIIRKLGVQSENVFLAQQLDEAEKLVQEKAPEIIISEFKIEEQSCLTLIDLQRQHHPNRLETLSCLISPVNLASRQSQALEKEIDLHLIRPITADLFEQSIATIIAEKIKPSKTALQLEKIRSLYEKQQFDEALTAIHTIQAEKEITNAKLLYYQGNILEQLGELVKALDCWEHGLDLDPINYWCLKALFSYFIDQKLPHQNYEIILKLLAHHPLNPDWIPHITRIFIANRKYQQIIDNFDLFVNWDNLDELDNKEEKIVEMHATIAACVVISAHHICKSGEKKKAVEALIKSVRLCQDRPKILTQIVLELVNIFEFKEANKVLALIEKKHYSPELHGAKLHILDLEEDADPQEILKQGIGLIDKNIKSEKIFEITILRSIELKRSQNRIDHLIEDACLLFSHKADFFKNLQEKKDISEAS